MTSTSHRQVLGDVCILGLGKTGSATAAYCLGLLGLGSRGQGGARVTSLTIYGGAADASTTRAAAPFIEEGIPVHFDTETVEGTYDLCIVSPGISDKSAFYASGRGASKEVVSEPEFAYRESPNRWVAVTGTNGKTTTTALIAHLLNAAGIPALAVGNIGMPCIEGVQRRVRRAYLVAELSSYQLASTVSFAPEVAVLLNIAPDHLAWHHTYDAYVEAKLKIFAHMKATDVAVIDATAESTRSLVRAFRGTGRRVIPLGTAEGITGDMTIRGGAPEAAFVDSASDDMLTVVMGGSRVALVKADALQIRGEHNRENALAAAATALALGAPVEAVRRGLVSFEPLEHRIEPCGVVEGVSYYNDSKATNTDATLKALTAFGERPLIVLLGGLDKGTALDGLVRACVDRCKAVVCFGQAAPRFLAAFEEVGATEAMTGVRGDDAPWEGALQVLAAHHLHDALETAASHAVAGDVVVLSPACASFDEFSSFEERGNVFKASVAALAAAEGSFTDTERFDGK